MPTYEFRCPDGHDFEKFYRSIGSAESVVACPSCGKVAERVMSAAGFAFKGSGFYLTDYGKNAHRGEAPVAPKSGAAGEGGTTSSGEGKGEAKPDSASSSSGSSASDSSSSSSSAPAETKKSEPSPAPAKPAPPAPKKGTSE